MVEGACIFLELVFLYFTLVLADCGRLLTCEIVDAEGNILVSETDGVLNYCARAIKGLDSMTKENYESGNTAQMPFYRALAKYAIAVREYTEIKNADNSAND